MSKQLLDTASKHPLSLIGLIDQAWNVTRDAAFKTGWRPMTRLAETAVVALMQRIKHGQLRVLTFDHIYTFPAPQRDTPTPEPKAELRVVSDVFWIRLCTMGDLGFAESYMYREVECDDLVALFKMFLLNKEELSGLDSSISFLFTLPQKLTSYRFLNTLSNSRSNISAHYDISNDMFKGFLSKDMTYSCAIFDELDGDLVDFTPADRTRMNGGQGLTRLQFGADSNGISLSSKKPRSNTTDVLSPPSSPEEDVLYTAQMRKLHHIIAKARIEPGQRVLEIGSGWGSLSILIAQTVPGTQVDTLTLSVQQKQLAEERIHAAGLDGRVRVHLMDYRDMPSEWEGAFDRLVSVEMIEAVGKEFMETYWRTVDWVLDRKKGVGVVQVITIPEARFEKYMQEIDFIRKWSKRSSALFIFFPGGFLPSLTYLTQTLTSGSQGRLVVDSVSNIGPHYARTLREWRRRFLDRFEDVIVPALMREYPDVMGGARGREEIEIFKRKWVYYYCYCEVGFTTRTLGDHIITFAREGYDGYGCNVFA